jgi:MFS family permease
VNGETGATGAVPGLETKQGGLGSRAQAVALATLCTVLFLTFLDNTVVSVGLADVQAKLHAGVTSLQWVVNGYALTFAAFMLAGGSLGDILGRKKIMLTGVAVFCAGSVVAALAPNVNWLIAGRVIMGLGAAASEPGTLSIIRHVYPDKGTRADALGVWAAWLTGGPSSGSTWPSGRCRSPWRWPSSPKPRTGGTDASTSPASSSVPWPWPRLPSP